MAAFSREERRRIILSAQSFSKLIGEPNGRAILREEAQDDDGQRLIEPVQLDYLLALQQERQQLSARPQLFGNKADVIIVPGFLGSKLTDTQGGFGLIWIDPLLPFDREGQQLTALKLGSLPAPASASGWANERDASADVLIEPTGTLPGMYDLLAWDLELHRYGTSYFAFDWRKDLEFSANLLAVKIRARQATSSRPLHLVAHSQGSLVARRALQLLGPDLARRLVSNLVLLGPASYGSFSAAFAFTGDNSSIDILERFGVRADFRSILQSFTGLYQLLPWNVDNFRPVSNGTLANSPPTFDPNVLGDPDIWKLGIDADRLSYGFGWGAKIDTRFFNDRTTILLGDVPMEEAIKFEHGHAMPSGQMVSGDGTVTDRNARLADVRTFRMPEGKHAMLAMYPTVIAAVRSILRGELPSLSRVTRVAVASQAEQPVPTLQVIEPGISSTKQEPVTGRMARTKRVVTVQPLPAATSSIQPPIPTAPNFRKLRVFSFDPLLATNVSGLGIAVITVLLPWDDDQLQPGPIGEYVEVIDYDPLSRRFYFPVDVTDSRLVAQDGLAPAESNPQFHQQMTYAVSMNTILTFEQALGRKALWAPRLQRDEAGEVVPSPNVEDEYVARLRIYPHAFRGANAYYDPDRHSILFGYFASAEEPGGQTLPGGVVFTCQSYDIIAHETTHALLHGLHRYYIYPSNPDVFAFHEAFADAVALFQKFSYTDVVRHQIARTRGNLRQQNLLGELAQQFGAALGGNRGALRKYIEVPPDPSLIDEITEPHDRGAILMAAMFRAFLNIYDHRTRDLYRIASDGTGILRDGEIAPDLVNRLAAEASKAARHFLTMCVRALDYVPPVDPTFGEYLRALITADYELVHNDDLHYRTAVIDAFRSWGLYPADVNVLDQSAMLWRPPSASDAALLQGVVDQLNLTTDYDGRDRRAAYLRMRQNCSIFHGWIQQRTSQIEARQVLGIFVSNKGNMSVPRTSEGQPIFEVHSVRRCWRIGPDGEQTQDLVVEIVQRRAGFLSRERQEQIDQSPTPFAFTERRAEKTGHTYQRPDFWFRGGCTLIIDPRTGAVRYSIYKSVLSESRLQRQRAFEEQGGSFALQSTYFDTSRGSPFALLHEVDSGDDIYG